MGNQKENYGFDKLIFCHYEERIINKSDMPLDTEAMLEKLTQDNPTKHYSKNVTIKEIKDDAVIIHVYFKDIK